MTDLEAIRARSSRRAYSGSLSHRQKLELEQLMAREKLHSGLYLRLLEDGATAFGGITKSYGMFTGVRSLILLAGHRHQPNLMELCGYHGQRVVLGAVKMGLGTCWVGGTFDKKRVAQDLPDGLELVAVITVGPVKENRGFMEKAVSGIAKRRGKTAAEVYTADETPPDWFLNGVNAALLAPSAVNRQPVRFTYNGGTACAGVQSEDGLNLVDLGIAKCHFEAAAGGRFQTGNWAPFEPTP